VSQLRDLGAAREAGTQHLEEAVAAWDLCLTAIESAWPSERVQSVRRLRDEAQAAINSAHPNSHPHLLVGALIHPLARLLADKRSCPHGLGRAGSPVHMLGSLAF
jgi:hypothetical protein